MSKQKIRTDRQFQMDQKLALKQRLGWAVTAALALAGALIIAWLVPGKAATYAAILLAVGVMLLYTWLSGAPLRAINEYTRRLAAGSTREMENRFLAFLTELEQKLPSMRKKELAFTIMYLKALLLYSLGRKEEALALLRSFDRVWDPAQRQRIDQLMARITGEAEKADAEPKEQA